jgi:hypothetical protein
VHVFHRLHLVPPVFPPSQLCLLTPRLV